MLIVKVGGGADINWNYIGQDLVSLVKERQIVIVHGASSYRDAIAEQLGAPTKYIKAPSGNEGVYTDKQALETMTMVYSGLINKRIVASLQKLGINALGMSGVDGRLWQGKRKKYLLSEENGKTKLIKDTFTGKVEKVNTELIKLLVDHDYLPVITQPAISYEGELINTDNDRALAVMAGALKVKELVSLFEAPGLLRNYQDDKTRIACIDREKLDTVNHYAKGRMKKKLLGVKEALSMGVETIYFGDGRIQRPITVALSGKGTVIS